MLEVFHDENLVGQLLVEFLALDPGLGDGLHGVLAAGFPGAHLHDSAVGSCDGPKLPLPIVSMTSKSR
jgi:hypothetical protein